ncbi:MAG: nucleotidyltransferase domain-containing protein [Gaiellaceae bacterium]
MTGSQGAISSLGAAAALEVLHALENAGVRVCVEGGWGVDALLQRQTREHADLDLGGHRDDRERLAAALAQLGYRHDTSARPGLPARFALVDGEGHRVDFHPLRFDSRGNGWLEVGDGSWYVHPAPLLWRDGAIEGERVQCIAAELQVLFRLGYPLRAEDEHDLTLLQRELGAPIPPIADTPESMDADGAR